MQIEPFQLDQFPQGTKKNHALYKKVIKQKKSDSVNKSERAKERLSGVKTVKFVVWWKGKKQTLDGPQFPADITSAHYAISSNSEFKGLQSWTGCCGSRHIRV